MVAMRLEKFGGMVPLLSTRLLPENMASEAVNTYFRGGEIKGIREPLQLKIFPHGIGDPVFRRAFRVPNPTVGADPLWVPFKSRFAKHNPSPLVNDAYNRFLFMDNNGPGISAPVFLNTFERIRDGENYYTLGVVAPQGQLTITPVGGVGPTITRSYLWTYVNRYGEEGQPSVATLINGPTDAVWNVNGLHPPDHDDVVLRGIDRIRIYRTISGNTGTVFYRVATVAVTETSYVDNRLDTEVVNEGIILESETWAIPELMEGFVAMPNGFFAGWAGKNIYFSEPYRPWAWPAEYTIATDYDIIDCGVIDQTLVALTKTAPVLVSGTHPAGMSISATKVVEPVAEANSIVQAPEGIYYASSSGLILISTAGMQAITREVIARDQWTKNYVPRITSSVYFDSQYIALSLDGTGFMLEPAEAQKRGICEVANLERIDNIWADPYTAEAHMMINNVVYAWADDSKPITVAEWVSKDFQFEHPTNMGGLMVTIALDYPTPGVVDDGPADAPANYGPWTDTNSIVGYNQVNGATVNGVPDWGSTPPGGSVDDTYPYWYGMNADPGFFDLPDGNACMITVYAENRIVWQKLVGSKIPYKLPSGFKSTHWRIAVKTRVPVLNIQFAETVKELRNV